MGQATCDCPNRGNYRFCIFPDCLPKQKGKRRRQFNHSSQMWIEVGEAKKRMYQRSHWEGNYARALQWHYENSVPMGDYFVYDWWHEPRTFYFTPDAAEEANRLYGRKLTGIKKGTTSYKPDFLIALIEMQYKDIWLARPNVREDVTIPLINVWREVKGHFEPKDFTKQRRMKQYHNIDVEFIAKKWFDANTRTYRSLIPDWATQ
jgi:hypothetical protein